MRPQDELICLAVVVRDLCQYARQGANASAHAWRAAMLQSISMLEPIVESILARNPPNPGTIGNEPPTPAAADGFAYIKCEQCEGVGDLDTERGGGIVKCDRCGGTGKVVSHVG